jgi:hypothetical protein
MYMDGTGKQIDTKNGMADPLALYRKSMMPSVQRAVRGMPPWLFATAT